MLIMDAAQEIFKRKNNFKSYSALDDKFSQCFGFAHAKVETLLTTARLEDKAEVIKSWYDGYIFGDSAVHCPWGVPTMETHW